MDVGHGSVLLSRGVDPLKLFRPRTAIVQSVEVALDSVTARNIASKRK